MAKTNRIWPKTTIKTVKVPDSLLAQKPENMTFTAWVLQALTKQNGK